MIPIPDRFLPPFIRHNPKARLFLMIFLPVAGILLVIYEAKEIDRSFRSGARFAELDETITLHLFDSAAVGLKVFYASHGHYPQTEGKYFFDSIKQYINIDEVYVYA